MAVIASSSGPPKPLVRFPALERPYRHPLESNLLTLDMNFHLLNPFRLSAPPLRQQVNQQFGRIANNRDNPVFLVDFGIFL